MIVLYSTAEQLINWLCIWTHLKVSKDDTIILDGDGDKTLIEERCQIIREAAEATSSDYEKEKLQERLAKIAGGVAVIKVERLCGVFSYHH